MRSWREELSDGFVVLEEGRRVLVSRRGWERVVQEVLGGAKTQGEGLLGGRGGAYWVPLAQGGRGVVRWYRRGGLLRHLVKELYWGRPPRPFVELIRTEEVWRRGIPVVPLMGALVEWRCLGGYRGAVLTQEAVGFTNLWQWLQKKPQDPERSQTLMRVARSLREMHQAGVDHRDLNLANVLVSWSREEAEVCFLDLDRVRLYSKPLGPGTCRKRIARMYRSLKKLDPRGSFFQREDLVLFHKAYWRGDEGFC